MGVLVQIRDVDENVRAQLNARAAARGLSFNAYLRELLALEVETPSREQVLARISAERSGRMSRLRS